jgi:hypothetical protein
VFANRIVGPSAVHSEDKSIVNPQPFGRRVNPRHRASRSVESLEVVGRSKKAQFTDVALRLGPPILPKSELDDGSQEWKQKNGFRVPWQILFLMSSLCFGVASFVLPDTVNDAVQWLLYGLMAAAIYAGFRKRRTETKS